MNDSASVTESPRELLDEAADHECYAILYEDKDDYYDESEMHILGDDSLDMYLSEAHRLKSEGHRNIRVIEYVTVAREVASV